MNMHIFPDYYNVFINNVAVGTIKVNAYDAIRLEVRGNKRLYLKQFLNVIDTLIRFGARIFSRIPTIWFWVIAYMLFTDSPYTMAGNKLVEIFFPTLEIAFYLSLFAAVFEFGYKRNGGFKNVFDEEVNLRIRRQLGVAFSDGDLVLARPASATLIASGNK
jgi:hypothetical protein